MRARADLRFPHRQISQAVDQDAVLSTAGVAFNAAHLWINKSE